MTTWESQESECPAIVERSLDAQGEEKQWVGPLTPKSFVAPISIARGTVVVSVVVATVVLGDGALCGWGRNGG